MHGADEEPAKAVLLSAVGAAILVMLCGCAVLPERQVTALVDVPPDNVVLVGRIELHPPLQKGEQELKTPRGKDLENVFIFYCGDRPLDFKAVMPASFAGSFDTTLEKEFFIKVGKDTPLYILGGTFYTLYDPPYRVVSHTFGSLFQVELRPDDEAVYIGTIQYFRDESNNLTSVSIRDDYQWADARFKERFGTARTLRKALPAPFACCK
jgi:hypothetical protein